MKITVTWSDGGVVEQEFDDPGLGREYRSMCEGLMNVQKWYPQDNNITKVEVEE